VYFDVAMDTLSSFTPELGNAKIEGLLPDLHMTGEQYNIALSIFFIPYVLAGKPYATTLT